MDEIQNCTELYPYQTKGSPINHVGGFLDILPPPFVDHFTINKAYVCSNMDNWLTPIPPTCPHKSDPRFVKINFLALKPALTTKITRVDFKLSTFCLI